MTMYTGIISAETAKQIAESKKKARNDFLRKVMTRAHAIRKETGADMSTALKAAWKLERIEEVEGQIFMLNMKDRWDDRDYATDATLNAKLRELKAA